MSVPTIRQYVTDVTGPTVSPPTYTLPAAPVPGNVLVLVAILRDPDRDATPDGTGWTKDGPISVANDTIVGAWKVCTSTAQQTVTVSLDFGGSLSVAYIELEDGDAGQVVTATGTGHDYSVVGPAVTPASGREALVIGAVAANTSGSPQVGVGGSGWSTIFGEDLGVSLGGHPLGVVVSREYGVSPGAVSPLFELPQSVNYAAWSFAIAGGEAELDPDDPDAPYIAPEPAGALLEIRAGSLGSARWGSALWGLPSVWSAAGWRDVTPQGIDAVIRWGSTRPELGILSQPTAGAWAVGLYDPERLLDPANLETPYAGDLVPGLPIRLSHRGVVVRTGVVESIGHSYAQQRGYIRATDEQATLSNATVPGDTELGNTLYQRARDAIAAAGLDTVVLGDPPDGDPDLVAWVAGSDRSAWDVIADAAQSVLHVPYIDRTGRLGFRAWAAPLVRGRTITSGELTELQAIAQPGGLFSVVRVQPPDPDDDLVVRSLTPAPRYGARTFTRSSPTPDPEAWAEAVLADRVGPGLRWIPGDLFPRDANSVERFATIEAVEVVSIVANEQDPPINVGAIVVGGELTVVGKRDAAASWRFAYEAAGAALPLLTEDGDTAVFLSNETGDALLSAG